MPHKIPTIDPSLLTPPTRTNYFTGRLLGADDFRREQEYHRLARRRLMLAVHGPGVVQGLRVEAQSDGSVTLSPGMAIDRLGREIIVPAPARVACDASTRRGPIHVCLGYQEELAEPVPVAGENDGTRFGVVRETFRAWTSPVAPSPSDLGHAISVARLASVGGARKKSARRR